MSDTQFVVGAAIVDSLANPSLVLATRRIKPESLAGRWEFPGGKVEPGEAPDDALIREVKEELDVTLMLGHELTPSRGAWPISERHTLRIFVAEIFVGTPTLRGSHDELRWLGAGELMTVEWLDADFAALPAVAELLRS